MKIFGTRSGFAALLDAIGVTIALGLVRALDFVELPSAPVWTLAAIATALLAVAYCGLYGLPALGDTRASVRRIAVAATMFALGSIPLTHFLTNTPVSVAGVVAAGAAAGLGLLAARATVDALWRHPRFRRRVLVVGGGELSDRLRGQLLAADSLGIELVGIVSNAESDRSRCGELFGRLGEVDKIVDDYGVGHVVLGTSCREDPFPADLLLAIKSSGIPVESGLEVSAALAERMPLTDFRPSELILGEGFAPGRTYEIVSRAIDVVGAAIGLALTSPVLALAMIAVRLESSGSAVYTQQRVGRGGREFTVFKLRSMTQNAEAQTGVVFAAGGNDARVTTVGRILRRTRIDELPQLWNVLRGDMSLVGPRPERPEFVDELQARYPYFYLRHAVRPGLTGLAQIRLGYVNDLDAWGPKLDHDIYYVKHRSLRLDLDVLLATTRTVLLMRGI